MGLFSGIVDAITSPVASVVGSLIGAGTSAYGQQQANQTSIDLANNANAFSAQQYATRYQTTVKDLQAAGLSPMLAYGQGAGSPPSAVGIAQQANKYGSLPDAASKAIGAANMANQTKLTDAQVAESISRTGVNDEERKLKDAQTKLAILEAPNVSQKLKNMISEELLNDARRSATHAQEAATRLDTIIRKTGDLPEAKKKGSYFENAPYNPYYLKDVQTGINSAASAVRSIR